LQAVERMTLVVLVTIDTEEDNWEPRPGDATVENIRELPRLDDFLRRFGVRATYFTTYQVATAPWAAATLRTVRDGGAEIGAHLHPWNTPPRAAGPEHQSTMVKNLPPAMQRAKIEQLTAALADAFGAAPTTFRAGRYGLGPTTVGALLQCGYRVDSSVTPYVNWEDTDGGPNFIGAPLDAYRLTPGRDPRHPDPDGPLLEIPVSAGYTRSPFSVLDRTRRILAARPLRAFRLAGLAWRAGVIKRTVLNPEIHSPRDMLDLSRQLIRRGVRHLNLTWHTPSLRPGLSPFVTTEADRERFYGAIESYLEGLAGMVSIRFATVSEAAAILDSPAAA
jgi:peptidoglycan/xylan/chitin deacetylase (PgdA/CDA1 family)